MSKEELSKLTIEEIENRLDEAIQNSHMDFLAQLTDEPSRKNKELVESF